MCIEDAYLNEVLIPGFLQTGMPTSLYDALGARGLRPTWAEDSITADAATDEEAALLEVAPGTPVLRHSRRALAGREGRRGLAHGLPLGPVHPLGAAGPGGLSRPSAATG